MNAINLEQIVKDIKSHEGFKSTPYRDSGHLTIGYGTQLVITKPEAQMLLIHRLSVRRAQLSINKWYKRLDSKRQGVILNMAYQLGYTGLMKFKHMIWRLKHNKSYNSVANAMQESKWYRQSGNRSKELVRIMRKGL